MSRLSSRLLTIALALVNRLRRRAPTPERSVQRILVAHYLLLGDTILLAPLLAKLAQHYPDAERIVLARPAVVPLFSGRPWGFRALAYDPRDFSVFRQLCEAGPFDLAYVLGDNRYAWLARAAGARWIVGFVGDRPAWKNWMVDALSALPDSPAALADLQADLVAGNAPPAFRAGDWPAPVAAPMDVPDRPYVVLHVGASTALKLWPAERWRALAGELASAGFIPLWSAGKGEEKVVDAIDPENSYRRYCGILGLAGMWQLLAGARLLVCPDTGIAHLGKLVGVPTVALFGPGSASIYGAGEYWRAAPYRAVAAADFPCRDQHLLFRREIGWVRRCGRDAAACARASAGLGAASGGSPCMQAISLALVREACWDFVDFQDGSRGVQPMNSNMQPVVSSRLTVIIPVHNAAPWLAQCLDSLLAQTRPADEIIIVDDGSTDDSPAIVAEYARRHPQFRLLQSGGGGASVARNTGLDAASGDWIGFVDADDWLEPDAYAQMLALGEAEALDMVLINGRYDYAGCPPDHRIYSDPPLTGVRCGGDWLAYKLENRSMLHMVWLHLYRREFIERYHLRFVPGITFEDVIWSTRALVLATRVDYIDTPFFYYRKLPRRLDPAANDRKMLHIIASSKVNAKTLAGLADSVSDTRLAGLIRWQLVDGGLAIFHRANQIVDRKLRNQVWWLALSDGSIGLLWRNAVNLRQRKKLFGRALRAILLKCLP